MKSLNIRRMTHLAILTAIILLMSFTPIGYLRIGPLSMTLLMVPVAVGAIVEGPFAGAFLGCIFGLTSFSQCFLGDLWATMLFSANPFYFALLCIVPRVLMGLLCGLIFKGLYNTKAKVIAPATASLSAAVLNTIFFMSFLVLLFLKTPGVFQLTEYNIASVLKTVVIMVGIQGLCEAGLTLIMGTAVSGALLAVKNRRQH